MIGVLLIKLRVTYAAPKEFCDKPGIPKVLGVLQSGRKLEPIPVFVLKLPKGKVPPWIKSIGKLRRLVQI
jgi:hypothetical protein